MFHKFRVAVLTVSGLYRHSWGCRQLQNTRSVTSLETSLAGVVHMPLWLMQRPVHNTCGANRSGLIAFKLCVSLPFCNTPMFEGLNVDLLVCTLQRIFAAAGWLSKFY
jgi:hypothetical protein